MRKLLGASVMACLLATGAVAQENAAGDAPAAEQSAQATAAEIIGLIQQGQLEEAESQLAAADLQGSMEMQVRLNLALAYARQENYDKTLELFEAEIDEALQSIDELESQMRVSTAANFLSMQGAQMDKADEILPILNRAIEGLREQAVASKETTTYGAYAQAVAGKSRLLSQSGKSEEAQKAIEDLLAEVRQFASENDAQSLLMQSLGNLSMMIEDPVRQSELFGEVREMAMTELQEDSPNAEIVSMYMSVAAARASRLANSDAEAAQKLIDELRQQVEQLDSSDPQLAQVTTNLPRMLSSLESRVESALRLQKLVGSPAPEIEAQHWVHGDNMSVDDLKGKVVLLDFWAVWCGPCIATFPHLREWQQEFGDQGFQVVGVTQKYGRVWDEEAERAVAPPDGGEVSDEQELEMLDKFMTHHELLHPTIVTPDDTDMYTEYGVSGIPHAVLIDRKGVVRMIKVGSGEENARELHEMITTLVAEQ